MEFPDKNKLLWTFCFFSVRSEIDKLADTQSQGGRRKKKKTVKCVFIGLALRAYMFYKIERETQAFLFVSLSFAACYNALQLTIQR